MINMSLGTMLFGIILVIIGAIQKEKNLIIVGGVALAVSLLESIAMVVFLTWPL